MVKTVEEFKELVKKRIEGDIPKKDSPSKPKIKDQKKLVPKEIEVKWLKEKSGHKPGDIIKIDEKLAEQLVKKGDAELLIKKKSSIGNVGSEKGVKKNGKSGGVVGTTVTTDTTVTTVTTDTTVDNCSKCSTVVMGLQVDFSESLEKDILVCILEGENEPITVNKVHEKIGGNKESIRQAIIYGNTKKGIFEVKFKKNKENYYRCTTDWIDAQFDEYNRKSEEKEEKEEKEFHRKSSLGESVLEAKNFFEIYKKEVGESIRSNFNVVYIDFMELAEFSNRLSDELLSNPEETLKILELALEERGVIDNPRVRIKNIPHSNRVFIENIRSKYVDKLIFIEGRVVSITDVRPQVVEAKFECPSCGTIISLLQNEKKFKEPSRCSCGRRGGFKLVSKEMVDTAKIILEDLQEKTDNPYTRRLNIFIKEDLTIPDNIRTFTPGNEVKIVGVLKEVSIPLRTGGISTRLDIAMDVNSVELSEEEVNILNFSDEEVREIQGVATIIDEKGLGEINSSFAPEVYGYEEIKNAIILQLCNKRNSPKEEGVRNKPNILLIGDPGVAKSVLGNFAVSITHGARRVVGGGSSAVGITASVIKEEDGWRVEPGAFVLARELLFIDELNNLQDEDKPKLQEAMSEQSVTISKANIRMKMTVTAGALATANPIRGVFDAGENFVKQFNLPLPIINRFDEIFIMKDNIDETSDEAIASRMVSRDRGTIESKYSKDFLKKFFVYVKNSEEPNIDNKIATRLKKLYSQFRRYKTSFVNINPRVNESILRLIKASAKIRLSNKVEEKDIERAINILSESYYNLPKYNTFRDIEKKKEDSSEESVKVIKMKDIKVRE